MTKKTYVFGSHFFVVGVSYGGIVSFFFSKGQEKGITYGYELGRYRQNVLVSHADAGTRLF